MTCPAQAEPGTQIWRPMVLLGRFSSGSNTDVMRLWFCVQRGAIAWAGRRQGRGGGGAMGADNNNKTGQRAQYYISTVKVEPECFS